MSLFFPETFLLPSLDRRRSAVRKHVIPGCDVPLMQLWCNTNSLSVKNRLLPNTEAVCWLRSPTVSKHANANVLPTSTQLHNRPPAGGTIHHVMYCVSIAAGTDPPWGGQNLLHSQLVALTIMVEKKKRTRTIIKNANNRYVPTKGRRVRKNLPLFWSPCQRCCPRHGDAGV